MHKESWIDLGHVIDFAVTLHKSDSGDNVQLFPGKASTQDEYLMTLKAEINNEKLPWLKDVRDEKVEFLVILDKSGSMDGRPWRQVQRAAEKMAKIVQQKVGIKFLVYDSKAQFTTEPAIQDMRSGGSTNFIATFEKIQEHMKNLLAKLNPNKGAFGRPSSKTQKEKPRKLFVFFMTDGEDTVNEGKDIIKAREHLQV